MIHDAKPASQPEPVPSTSTSLKRRWLKIGGIIALAYLLFAFSPISFIFYPQLAGRMIPIFHAERAAESYSKAAFHHLANQITAFESNVGPFPGGKYWGPLTPDLIRKLAPYNKETFDPPIIGSSFQYSSPAEIVDPFNRDPPSSAWRHGIRYVDDHGGVVYVKGGNFQFYSNGENRWVLIGRGPDGKLEVTQAILEHNNPGVGPVPTSELMNLRYDPSNGTNSTGDIIRIKP